MAKRGHSRDHRPDCPQVCIGLVVTEEGLPLGYEVFEGNRHDSKTVEDDRRRDGSKSMAAVSGFGCWIAAW